ncbi:hypothetical protein HOLleu_28118 [Holothuria leucospilota]|uniref:Uncharacterized protein n=1 Tax=Holothuria leucospilota TaxID=206669 RepID=A0A9Q1BLK5_HOLLE|nr:hypothetical protein HOLleu_28118 [Holothuria leucospilota]
MAQPLVFIQLQEVYLDREELGCSVCVTCKSGCEGWGGVGMCLLLSFYPLMKLLRNPSYEVDRAWKLSGSLVVHFARFSCQAVVQSGTLNPSQPLGKWLKTGDPSLHLATKASSTSKLNISMKPNFLWLCVKSLNTTHLTLQPQKDKHMAKLHRLFPNEG